MILKFNYKLQSQIKVEFNYKANSIYSRIQPIVAKSKMVKVKSQRKSKTHQSAGLLHFTALKSSAPVGFQGLPAMAHGTAPLWTRICAGELESWSWKLGTELEAASWCKKFNKAGAGNLGCKLPQKFNTSLTAAKPP